MFNGGGDNIDRNEGEGPLAPFLSRQGFLVLDGGLATELEARGCDLADPLWSARALIEAPSLIRDVHLAFLDAGADCIATATYQASLEGFRARGLSPKESAELFQLAVQLAVDARDTFWSDPANRIGRLEPLVVTSLGPFGAYLADGSEYRGGYDVSEAELRSFHSARFDQVRDSGADLTAWETVPSYLEVGVLRALLCEHPDAPAWVSLSCRDGTRIADGTSLAEVARDLDRVPGLCAVGINCTQARFVASLASEARAGTRKPILVYPNAGGGYDAESKTWAEPADSPDWSILVPTWRARGVFGVGGCCRVGPEDIRAIRTQLSGRTEDEVSYDQGAPQGAADVVCPYCSQSVEVLLDPEGGGRQDYVEDCEVCCRPWHLIVTYDRAGSARVEIARAD